MKSESQSYRAAGVDITAGYRAVELMQGSIARTLTQGVLGGIGGFGGLFELDVTGMQKTRAGVRHGRRGHQAAPGLSDGPAR